jgi:transposase-like protein
MIQDVEEERLRFLWRHPVPVIVHRNLVSPILTGLGRELRPKRNVNDDRSGAGVVPVRDELGNHGACLLVELDAKPVDGQPRDLERVVRDHRALLHWPLGHAISKTPLMKSHRYPLSGPTPRSAFARYRFPQEIITLAVRWYLRFGLSYRDVEELLAERGIEVDHVTIFRWVQRFAPEFAEAARARQHLVGDRWHVDETYLKVGGTWRYLFRAIDQFGQVIDVFLSPRRNEEAARRFFAQAISRTRVSPTEVTTDRYRVYPRVLGDLLPAAFHDTEVHANNPLETDHGRLKARLRPMRGLKRDRTARVILAGHAFIQNLRRGFYDLGTAVRPTARLADAFAELALVI